MSKIFKLISKISSWFFGLFFLFIGIGGLLRSSFSGLLYIFAGSIIIPPLNKFIRDRFNIKYSGKIFALTSLVLFIIGGVFSTLSPRSPENQKNSNSTNSQTAFKTETDNEKKDRELREEQQKKDDQISKTNAEAIDKIIKEKADSDKKIKDDEEKQKLLNKPRSEKIADIAKSIFQKPEGAYVSAGDISSTLDVDTSKLTAWDEKHYLELMLEDFVKFGNESFKIDGVTELNVRYNGTIVDKYGKESKSAVYSIFMAKENFIKYSFENLKGSDGRMYRAIEQDALIYILPSTRLKIDFAKVKYLPASK
jgi:hypothetical protein